MLSRRMGCELAIVAVVCILGIFLFPAMSGPYPATHGPVTVLQSARSSAKLRLAILVAWLSALRTNWISSLVVRVWAAVWNTGLSSVILADASTILRC